MKTLRDIVPIDEGFRQKWAKAGNNPRVKEIGKQFKTAAGHLGIQYVKAPMVAGAAGAAIAMQQGKPPAGTAAVLAGGTLAMGAAASVATGTLYRAGKHGMRYLARRAIQATKEQG